MKVYKYHNEHLSKEAIAKYLQNEFSSKEMYIVEKHLLSCSFCTEAVEGFQDFSEVNIIQVSNQLQQKLKQRTTKKAVYYRWWVVASITLLLTFFIFFLFDVMNENNEKTAFFNPENSEKKLLISNETITDTLIADKSVKNINESDIKKKIIRDSLPKEINLKKQRKSQIIKKEIVIKKEKDNLIALADKEILKKTDHLVMETKQSKRLKKLNIATDAVSPVLKEPINEKVFFQEKSRVENTFYPTAMNENQDNQKQLLVARKRSVSGTVYDENNQAVPGVNIIVKGTTIGTITDINGKYQLEIEEHSEELVFSFIGLKTKVVSLKNKDVINVNLVFDTVKLSEVAIITTENERNSKVLGYSVSKSEQKTTKATPIGGYEKYKKYIQSFMKYPQKAIENKVEGVVKMNLIISKKGEILNILILDSLGYGCEEESIRLIKEGVRWNPAKKNGKKVKDKVEMSVKF